MQPPLVSVIIPCFQQAHFLGEAIESVFEQTYRRFQVIVVDDGSPDDVAAVVARFRGVDLIGHEHLGQAAARNRGFRASAGELLVFLDADDRLVRDALRVGVECLASHPRCAFAYGQVHLIAADGSPLELPHQEAVVNDYYATLLSRNYIWSPGAVMYRRTVFDAVAGFDSRADGAADYELNVRIARWFPIIGHDQVVLEYRVHGSNWSGNPEAMLRSAVTAHRLQRKYVKNSPRLSEAYRAGLQVVRQDYGSRLAAVIGQRVRARQWTAAARGTAVLLRYHPGGFVEHVRRKVHAVFARGQQR